ncbi:MAG: ATP-binding cassette domain-containing protein [Thermoplasmata archaeon]|nr:ATP-binding cassette domain-containing protein [Thermoplasmata archaeon]
MNALRMRDVSVRYPDADRDSLDSVSLDIARGEWVLLLGANGAGKSTLCMLTNGLIPHVVKCSLKGQVEVFGKDVARHSVATLSTKVGIVFQEPENQLFCMSAEEEVAFGPENLAIDREEIAARVEWALETVGLLGCNDRPPSSLSGGQKQRLAIAAALSMRPEMLVLDEPTYALDPIGRIELYSLLADLKKKHNMTVLVVERDAEEAAAFADRIALMSEGRIVRTGRPKEVLADPNALRFIGVPPPQLCEFSEALYTRVGGPKIDSITLEAVAREISTVLSAKKGVEVIHP